MLVLATICMLLGSHGMVDELVSSCVGGVQYALVDKATCDGEYTHIDSLDECTEATREELDLVDIPAVATTLSSAVSYPAGCYYLPGIPFVQVYYNSGAGISQDDSRCSGGLVVCQNICKKACASPTAVPTTPSPPGAPPPPINTPQPTPIPTPVPTPVPTSIPETDAPIIHTYPPLVGQQHMPKVVGFEGHGEVNGSTAIPLPETAPPSSNGSNGTVTVPSPIDVPEEGGGEDLPLLATVLPLSIVCVAFIVVCFVQYRGLADEPSESYVAAPSTQVTNTFTTVNTPEMPGNTDTTATTDETGGGQIASS